MSLQKLPRWTTLALPTTPPPPDKTWSTYTADKGGFHLTKQQNMQWRLSAPTGDACQATFSTAQECSRHVNQNNVHRYVFVLWKSSFPMYPPTPRKYLLPLNPLPLGISNDLPWRGGVWIFSGTTQSDEKQLFCMKCHLTLYQSSFWNLFFYLFFPL